MSLIACIQLHEVLPLRGESVNDEANQAVLIRGNIHDLEVIAQIFARLLHLLMGEHMALADDRLADLTFLPQHIRQAAVIGLNRHAGVLDGDALVTDELRSHSSNVDFAPAIGNGAVSALDIRHGGR